MKPPTHNHWVIRKFQVQYLPLRTNFSPNSRAKYEVRLEIFLGISWYSQTRLCPVPVKQVASDEVRMFLEKPLKNRFGLSALGVGYLSVAVEQMS
jgi:hypothetical protein